MYPHPGDAAPLDKTHLGSSKPETIHHSAANAPGALIMYDLWHLEAKGTIPGTRRR